MPPEEVTSFQLPWLLPAAAAGLAVAADVSAVQGVTDSIPHPSLLRIIRKLKLYSAETTPYVYYTNCPDSSRMREYLF